LTTGVVAGATRRAADTAQHVADRRVRGVEPVAVPAMGGGDGGEAAAEGDGGEPRGTIGEIEADGLRPRGQGIEPGGGAPAGEGGPVAGVGGAVLAAVMARA
jgi:hypothetical protein